MHEADVFHRAPVGQLIGLRLGAPVPFAGEQSAGQRSVSEQPDARCRTETAHVAQGTAVEKGTADLVRHDGKAVRHRETEMIRIEIGDTECTNAALAAKSI